METEQNDWRKTGLIGLLVVIGIGYLVWGEVRSYQATTIFCKQQCTYSATTKEWKLDVQSEFDAVGVSSTMETSKSFPEKDLDECINYCRELGRDLRNAQQ